MRYENATASSYGLCQLKPEEIHKRTNAMKKTSLKYVYVYIYYFIMVKCIIVFETE